MFENNLYSILELKLHENNIQARIELDPSHEIFKGHFPEMPILPGVCMIQIIKEIVSKALPLKLTLVYGDNLKFTALIKPTEQKFINVEFNIVSLIEEKLVFNCQVTSGATIAFKMKGTYSCKPQNN